MEATDVFLSVCCDAELGWLWPGDGCGSRANADLSALLALLNILGKFSFISFLFPCFNRNAIRIIKPVSQFMLLKIQLSGWLHCSLNCHPTTKMMNSDIQ